jgi:type I restriction enzyme S subunit
MELKPGYKQTEVGVIPEDWDTAIVGQSFDICNQLRLPLSRSDRNLIPDPYPYYGPTGVQGWINEYRVEGKYALIGEDGDHFLKWQAQPMTKLVEGRFNVNNHAHLVKGSRNLTEWFYWYFSNRDITTYLTRQGAGRFKLTKAALTNTPCALPPPCEQLAISKTLSEVDALLSSLEQLLFKKNQIKQAAMQELLTGKRRLPGFEGEWEVKTLFDLANRKKEFFDDGDWIESEHITTEGIRLIQTGNIGIGDFVDKADKKFINERSFTSLRCKQLMHGDLLICRLADPAGRSCVLPDIAEERIVTSVDVTIFRPPADLADRHYLNQVFSTPDWLRSVSDRSGGTTHKRISRGALGRLSINLPSLPEQTAIAEVLCEMDSELVALEAQKNKAQELKQGMMLQLLTGKIRLI